jgi:hypothetical protein
MHGQQNIKFFNCVLLETYTQGVLKGLEYGDPNDAHLANNYSLGIFIAVRVIHKQPDSNESLYLQNILLLIFYPCFEDHTVFIVMPNDIGVIPVGTLLLGVPSFSTQYIT